ncbi:MAG: molybdopterin-binding protein [Actinomycetota bacterium]
MRVGDFAATVLDLAKPLTPLDLPLLDAHGATLASDVRDGERLLLPSGVRIRSTQIALAAASGLDRLPTRPQPRVVVIALADMASSNGSGAETNSFLLTTAVKEAGAYGYRVLLQAETQAHIKAVIEDQLVRADLLLITGDVGDRSFDEILEVLSRIGEFNSVDVKYLRGGRHAYGVIGPDATPALLFPGDPIAAYISTEIFARPMIRSMMGLYDLHRPVIQARLDSGLSSVEGFHEFLLASLDREVGVVRVLEDQSSLLSLAEANALVAISSLDVEVKSGSEVDVIMLERRYL